MARGHCAAVDSNDCTAPAGVRAGSSIVTLPQRTGLLRCAYCSETVCPSCATAQQGVTLCPGHSEHELELFLAAIAAAPARA